MVGAPTFSSSHHDAITCLAPAKVNLALHVTSQRADGYHMLESLVVFCDVADKVSLSFDVAESHQPQLEFSGRFGETLRSDPDNLVLRACSAFFTQSGRLKPAGSIHFHLEKNLPVSSGIGGGSADAAAALLCLGKAIGDITPNDLTRIGASLGADVPMCLKSEPLIAQGVGDAIETLEAFPGLHMVLVNPGRPVATPEVFARLETKANSPLAPLPSTLSFDAITHWLGEQRNDLQLPAIDLVPEIGETLDVLHASGAAFARMSGSGATCFGLYADAAAAQTAADAIAAAHQDWWVEATQTQAFGANRV